MRDKENQGTEVLQLPLDPSRSETEGETVRDYLVALLARLWRQGEGFSGKRPFGESNWKHDIYITLVRAGLVGGSFDEHGRIEHLDRPAADKLVSDAIEQLGKLYPTEGRDER